MAFVPVPNTVQAELIFSFNANTYENTLYFEKGSVWSIGDMDALGADLIAWWVAEVATLLADDLELQMVKMTSLESAISPISEVTAGLPQAGDGSTDPLPPTNAMVITFKTDQRGRSYRGRNYMVGFQEDQQSAGIWSSTYTNALELAYIELIAVAAENSATWVVVSRYTNNAERTTGVTTPITSVTAQPIVATQRRRRLSSGS